MSAENKDDRQDPPIISTMFGETNHLGAVENGELRPFCGSRGKRWIRMGVRYYSYGGKDCRVEPEVSCLKCQKLRNQ